MINPNEAVQAFKEKFSKMSYDEREQYLKKMGFSFGEECEKDDILLAAVTQGSFIKEIPNSVFSKKRSKEKNLNYNKAEIKA